VTRAVKRTVTRTDGGRDRDGGRNKNGDKGGNAQAVAGERR